MIAKKIKRLAQPLTTYLDARTMRERVMVLLAAGASIAFIGYALLVLPIDRAAGRNRAEADNLRQQIAAEAAVLAKTMAVFEENSNEGKRRRIAQLEDELRHSDRALQQLSSDLVGPREMVRLIRDIVASTPGIKVRTMSNRAPQPIRPDDETPQASGTSKTSDEPAGLYKHGLEITVEGSYWPLVRFLHTVETMPWRVLWEDVELKTLSYPKAQMSLVIYTLSTDSVWMQV